MKGSKKSDLKATPDEWSIGVFLNICVPKCSNLPLLVQGDNDATTSFP